MTLILSIIVVLTTALNVWVAVRSFKKNPEPIEFRPPSTPPSHLWEEDRVDIVEISIEHAYGIAEYTEYAKNNNEDVLRMLVLRKLGMKVAESNCISISDDGSGTIRASVKIVNEKEKI